MIEDWKNLLRGGFAYETASFAIHPCDKVRAQEMVLICKCQKIPLTSILKETRRYLTEKGYSKKGMQEQLNRVREFYGTITFQTIKKKAWLVYWSSSEKKFNQKDVIAVFDSRKSSEYISNFIFQYYIASTCSLEEKIHFSSHARDFPYQVEFEKINGTNHLYSISCGHHSTIFACMVKNLAIFKKLDGSDILNWEEYPG